MKKQDRSLRLYVDYRALNDITIKDRYPLPRIEETLNQVQGAKYFTRLDLRTAYNLIRIKKGDEWKTVFRTRYGLYEFLVMPLGLMTDPASCQRYVNNTLRECLDIFCMCYLYDILIYSKNLKEYHHQVQRVLKRLYDAGLYVQPEKYELNVTTTTFLGFVISRDGISMDTEKVQAVQNWERPKCVRDLQYFLGFATFYRRFIETYSRICQPICDVLKKEKAWPLSEEFQKVFDQLKERFCMTPILKRFNLTLETMLETYASDSILSGILSQKYLEIGKLVLHHMAYLSEKMSPAQYNHGFGDKEVLAIVASLEKWHIYLYAHLKAFTIHTDHHNVLIFSAKPLLNRRQARWASTLVQYDFTIAFRPGI